jgi:Domain of unknown function (DUF4124)
MARNSWSRLCPSILVAALAAPAVAAQEVYRWVDENAVVDFRDRPPAAASAEVSTVAVPSTPSSGSGAASDVYNVEATAARTQAHRDKLAQQRDNRAAPPGASSAPVVQQQGQVVDHGYPYDYPAGPRPPRPDRPIRPQPEPIADDAATLRPVSRSRRN